MAGVRLLIVRLLSTSNSKTTVIMIISYIRITHMRIIDYTIVALPGWLATLPSLPSV